MSYLKLQEIAAERQRHYMQLAGQIDANGKMLIDVNYIELLQRNIMSLCKQGK